MSVTDRQTENVTTLVLIAFVSVLQETEGQKTNNGIQYRLQLLYANGT